SWRYSALIQQQSCGRRIDRRHFITPPDRWLDLPRATRQPGGSVATSDPSGERHRVKRSAPARTAHLAARRWALDTLPPLPTTRNSLSRSRAHGRSTKPLPRQFAVRFVGGSGLDEVPAVIGPMYDVAITRLSYHLSFCWLEPCPPFSS